MALRALICDSSVATEEEIQKDIDKLDVELHRYEKSLTDIKKNHSIILGRCKAVMAKSQRATDSTSIPNPATTPSKSKHKQDGETGNIVPQPLDGNAPNNKIKLTCNFQCNFQSSLMKRSKAKQRLRSHIHDKHSKDQRNDVDSSPHVAIDAMDSISIDSNASLLETAKVGATLLNP